MEQASWNYWRSLRALVAAERPLWRLLCSEVLINCFDQGRDDEGHGASVAVLVSMRRWQKDESCVQYGAKLGPFPVRLGIWQDFHSSMTQTPPFLPPPTRMPPSHPPLHTRAEVVGVCGVVAEETVMVCVWTVERGRVTCARGVHRQPLGITKLWPSAR